jgi:formate dehydrogenase subunit gamma
LNITWDSARAERIIAPFECLEGPLLPMLQALQTEFSCIPDDAIPFLANKLNLSRAEVYGVVSFYHDFRREPRAHLCIKVCRGEACQARGGRETAAVLLDRLGLDWGETAQDGSVAIEPVYCLGLCAVAPAALIGETPAGRLDGARLVELVEAAR